MITLIRRTSLVVRNTCRNMCEFKTFAFIDLETTGLPYYDNKTTKITELTIATVLSEHLSLGVVPRVQNKLSLCFNPGKLIDSQAEKITGLSNEALEHLAPFTNDTIQTINSFLKHNPKPICFVAHNGDEFDYPILRTAIEKCTDKIMEDIMCIDSLKAFRELHLEAESNEKVPMEFHQDFNKIVSSAVHEYETSTGLSVKRSLTFSDSPVKIIKKDSSPIRKRLNFSVSFKLTDVYQRLTNQIPKGAHRAEKDVEMLTICAATLGDRFIDWANDNYRLFSSVPVMSPFKKIGT